MHPPFQLLTNIQVSRKEADISEDDTKTDVLALCSIVFIDGGSGNQILYLKISQHHWMMGIH
jgi:hypothetical protein